MVVDFRSGDEFAVEIVGEDGFGEEAEEEFEDGGDGRDVVEEGGGEAEIDLVGVVVKHGAELVDVAFIPGNAVDAFGVEAVEVDCGGAGVDYAGDAVVAVDERFEGDAKDGVEGRVFGEALVAVVAAWLLLGDVGGRAGGEDGGLGYDGSETAGLRLLGKRGEWVRELGRELGDLRGAG